MNDHSHNELASRVADLLDGRTVATAESCTAGRIAEALATVEKAAEWLVGGLVAYQDDVKRALLNVRAPSVLSLDAAAQMARGVVPLLNADVAVATTGVAGDEPTDGVAPGTVFIATCVDGRTAAHQHRFEGSPSSVCEQARDAALRSLIAALGDSASV